MIMQFIYPVVVWIGAIFCWSPLIYWAFHRDLTLAQVVDNDLIGRLLPIGALIMFVSLLHYHFKKWRSAR